MKLLLVLLTVALAVPMFWFGVWLEELQYRRGLRDLGIEPETGEGMQPALVNHDGPGRGEG